VPGAAPPAPQPLPAPAASTAPRITGTAMVGRTLRATTGTWDVDGVTLARQWLVGGRPVAGATGPTYTVRAADVGKPVSVRVSARSAGRPDGAATSAATARVAKARTTTRVTAPGTARPGRGVVVRVAVTATGVTPTGRVRVYDGRRLVRVVRLVAGRARATVVLRGTGVHRLRAAYAGTPAVAPSAGSTTVRVRR
jgi:hypothetical protein